MRISVEVEDEILKEVMALTGESGKGPALSRAIEEFVKRRKAAEFGRLIRENFFDYPEISPEMDARVNPIPQMEE
jgi:hypothetical protein